MNKRYSIVIVLSAILSLLTSCLGNDTTDVNYYDDIAITGFSVGNFNRRVYATTNAGKDTSYIVTVQGSKYPFSIDHANGKIYNVDSLPSGVDTRKCLVTVTTLHSGQALLKSLTSDSLNFFAPTDSLDFSQKRTISVIANDGRTKKDYEVEVRVHKEKEDSLYWTMKAKNSSLAALTDMKAVCFRGKLYVVGVAGGTVRMYSTALTDGVTWTEIASAPFASMPSITCNRQYLYVHSGDKIYRSADGSNWDEVADGTGIKAVIAASRSEVYALSTDGNMLKSSDNGVTWTYDALDSDASFLPQQSVSGFYTQAKVNTDVDKVLIFGNRDVATDTTAVVWTKSVDNSNPAETMPWMYQPFTSDTWHHAPRFNRVSVVRYADGALLLGNIQHTTFHGSSFYFLYSWDFGLNWWHDKRFTLPYEMDCSPTSFALATDDDNTAFWIISGESGEVWRGYFSTWTWQ